MARGPTLKPRKPPRQRRSAATVEAILEAAARILESRGLAGFNTNAVAERAGISIGSLYQYFPGKEALTAALIERAQADLRAKFNSAVAEAIDLPFEAGLRRLLRIAIRHQAERPQLARVLDFEERRLPLAETLESSAVTIRAGAERFLRAHRGRLRRGDRVGAIAADVITIVRALIDADAESGRALDITTLEHRLMRAVCGYLGAAPAMPRLVGISGRNGL